MEYNEEIRDRILLQVAQIGAFHTEDEVEIQHVGLLIDESFVDGVVFVDDAKHQVRAAHIYRMKRRGYEKLSQIRTPSVTVPDYSGLRTRSNEMIAKSSECHDNLMGMLAAGGIGLFFTFLSILGCKVKAGDISFTVCEWLFSALSLSCWILALVLLLWSHFQTIDQLEKRIRKIDAGKFSESEANAERDRITKINMINALLTVGGIVFFAIFVILVLAVK